MNIWKVKILFSQEWKELFSIAICIDYFGKMLIWGHFCSIMKLLLNNYLGHFLIIEKTFFYFIESAINLTPLLHANVQMPWRTECNRLNWWPECFYEAESPVTTSTPHLAKSGQQQLAICNIHRSYGWTCIHAGSSSVKTWVFQKNYRRLHNCE